MKYGWKPSLPDFRDFSADTILMPILDEVDPRGEMSPIYNQGQLGSCTANAVAACIDYDRKVNGEKFYLPSRLGIYYLERVLEGSPLNQDTGAFGRNGFKAAQKIGILPEDDLPYLDDVNKVEFSQDPRQNYKWATDHIKLERPYKSVPRAAHIFRQVLSNRQTIAFGFSVYESFESNQVETTGIVPIPKHGESLLGGHEVLIVGYLKEHPHFWLVRNSWGAEWGLGGYCLFPIQITLDPKMSDDFRTIYRPQH